MTKEQKTAEEAGRAEVAASLEAQKNLGRKPIREQTKKPVRSVKRGRRG